MKCPHCRVDFHDRTVYYRIDQDTDGDWFIAARKCAACKKLVLHLIEGEWPSTVPAHVTRTDSESGFTVRKAILIRPKASSRPPSPAEVPQNIAEDYTEACLVLPDSPKASSALSRRCLQHILREAAKVKPNNLDNEIQQVIDSRTLPSYIVEAIDAIRVIGNFAAHPLKSQVIDEIVPVEPEEAEWNLDVLEALFDFYYVQPTALQRKKDGLNLKLQEAGKKPMR